jgi:hypothetical protein
MASKKLTKGIRDSIVNIVLTQTFEKRKEKASSMRAKLFKTVCEWLLPNDFNQKTKSLPEAWFRKINEIDVRGDYHHFVIGLRGDSVKAPDTCFDDRWSSSVGVMHDSLPKRVQTEIGKVQDYEGKISTDRDKLKSEITKIVYACNTYKQLKEAWPDVEKYYILDDSTPNLPAQINPEEVKKMIKNMVK